MKNNALQKNIPEGWHAIPAGEIFTFVKSYAFSRENLSDESTETNAISNIHYGDIHSSFSTPSIDLEHVSVPKIKDTSFKPKSEDLLQDGDLIMVDASEDYEGVGTTVSVHGIGKKKVVGGLHTFVLRDEKNKTDTYFRQYVFRNPEVRNELQKVANGVSVYGISKTAVSKILLPIPSLSEQKRIVSILETWDEKIEKLSEYIVTKKQILHGLTQELLSGKSRLAGFKKDWNEVKFGELFSERSERGIEGLPLLSITSDRGVIYQTESNKKDTSNSDKSKYLRICPGDIGYNTMRMWQGRSALSKLNGLVSPAYTILSPKKNVDSRFFAYFFKTPRVVNYFFQKSQGLVSDTLQCRYKDFAIIRCHVPEYEEQRAIADVLETADKEIKLLEEKLEKLNDQKRYLLNNLVTGKIRTPESLSTTK